jgi:metallo-beta-lactamase class B
MRKTLLLAAALTLLLAQPSLAADPFSQQRLDWNKPMKPFRVIGPIYYVGTAGVSAFLIVTLQGLILTDGGLPESAPLIEANIKTLGYKMSDVRVLLNSHAHFDHAGGLAKLKRDSGAKLYASAADKPFLEKGRISFGPSAADPFPPVHVDHVVADGDTVILGGTTLTAHLTPGHTPGCTSWTMDVADGKLTHPLIFFCSITDGGNPMVNNKAYPRIADDYRASFAKLKKMDADIFLAPHGDQFGLAKKKAALDAAEKAKQIDAPNPFIDKTEMHRFLDQQEKNFERVLAKQQAAAETKKP